jgi:hypothetical protein
VYAEHQSLTLHSPRVMIDLDLTDQQYAAIHISKH